MVEVAEAWTRTVQHKQGLFSTAFKYVQLHLQSSRSDELRLCSRRNPLDQETQFTPTDKDAMTQEYTLATRSLHPHAVLLSFLSSRFQAFRYRDQDLVLTCMRLLMRSSTASATWRYELRMLSTSRLLMSLFFQHAFPGTGASHATAVVWLLRLARQQGGDCCRVQLPHDALRRSSLVVRHPCRVRLTWLARAKSIY